MSKCKNCVYITPDTVCVLVHRSVNPEGQGCQCFAEKTSISRCDICGKQIINPIIYQTGSTQKYICSSCSSASGTCKFCKYHSQCEFETNSSPYGITATLLLTSSTFSYKFTPIGLAIFIIFLE